MLARDVLVTPPFTRVSRMIRDISAVDIMAGSKKTNLRQLVEASDALKTDEVREIRFREIAGEEVDISALMLDMIAYETTNTSERFLQWITPEGKIAGFLRLSLPHEDYLLAHAIELPDELGCAMIREVHVYGQVATEARSTSDLAEGSLSVPASSRAKPVSGVSTSSARSGRAITIASSASWMTCSTRRGSSSRQNPTCGLPVRARHPNRRRRHLARLR